MGISKDEAIRKLRKVASLNRRIRRLRERILEEESRAQYKGTKYSNLPPAPRDNLKNSHDRYVQKVIDEFEHDINDLKSQIDLILEVFYELPDDLYKVLCLRYIEGLSWAEIASETGYVESTCRKYKYQAFEQLKNS